MHMAPPKIRTAPRLRVVADMPAELSDRPIQRPTGLVEEVYTRVRAEIMSLAIPPDTRVPAREDAAPAVSIPAGAARREDVPTPG